MDETPGFDEFSFQSSDFLIDELPGRLISREDKDHQWQKAGQSYYCFSKPNPHHRAILDLPSPKVNKLSNKVRLSISQISQNEKVELFFPLSTERDRSSKKSKKGAWMAQVCTLGKRSGSVKDELLFI